ncbi:AI-2E family transporter [Microbacteriaceae bacterium 4G12]
MKNIKMIWIYRLALLLLIFLCLLVLLKLKPIWLPLLDLVKLAITPFLIAYFIAYLLHPLIEKLHDKGMPRTLAILLIYVLFFGGVGYGVYKGIPVAMAQMQDMNENTPQFMAMYETWTDGIQANIENFPEFISEKLKEVIIGIEGKVQQGLNKIISTARGILDSLLIIFLIPFMVFYILKDYGELYNIFWKLIPEKWRKGGQELAKEIDTSLGAYIRGQIFVCLVLAGLASLALWIIGMRYPLLLGIIIGVTDIIPYFGPILGAIPTLIIAATVSVNMLIKTAVALAVVQFVESNILSPYIVGKSVRMHPVVIMLSLLVGGEIGGIMGLILAVPVLAVVRTIVMHSRLVWKKR